MFRRQLKQKNLRRRGSEVLPLSRASLGRRSLVRRLHPAYYAPWKIFNPHSTMTMADISVAAVNTLSKEATLILLSASQPH